MFAVKTMIVTKHMSIENTKVYHVESTLNLISLTNWKSPHQQYHHILWQIRYKDVRLIYQGFSLMLYLSKQYLYYINTFQILGYQSMHCYMLNHLF